MLKFNFSYVLYKLAMVGMIVCGIELCFLCCFCFLFFFRLSDYREKDFNYSLFVVCVLGLRMSVEERQRGGLKA